jgi:large subunit ribosomal protein L11
MSEQTVDLIVDGGEAKAGQALAQPLAPLGINIQEIVTNINEKTLSFKGMKVPVKIVVETINKSFEITVGSPSVTELIKKEIRLDKGSGEPNKDKKANLSIEQVIKIAKMKQDSMLVNNLTSAVNSIIGSCNSLGIIVEGKEASLIIKDVKEGKFKKEITEESTETSQKKFEKLATQLKSVQQKIKKELDKEKAEAEAEEAEKKKIEEAVAAEAIATETPEEEKKESEEKTEDTEEASENKKEESKEEKK